VISRRAFFISPLATLQGMEHASDEQALEVIEPLCPKDGMKLECPLLMPPTPLAKVAVTCPLCQQTYRVAFFRPL
jgi:hypothetical protein